MPGTDPGIGTGVGGFFASLMNPNLAGDVARHITPNPNPLAQQGGPQDPKAVDSLGNPVPTQQPNLAPAAVTQPDPVNASYAADLMRYDRMNKLSDDLNRNIQGVAAGFGTAQQQASKQAALGAGGGVGDSLGALAKIQGMQDQTVQDNEHARFMGNATIFAQALRNQGINVTDAQATEIMNNKGLLEQFGGAAAGNATFTGTQKDAEAATREWAAAHPKATPQEIADYKANLIAGGMGGSDLGQRQYLAERSAALAAGQKDFPDYPTWQANHAADAAAKKKTADDAADFKNTATVDYTSVHSKQTDLQQYIDTLKKDPMAAKQALLTPWPTSGPLGAWDPLVPQNVKDAAVALDKIRSSLKADQLSGVKNVRNRTEFDTLGQAATAGLNPAATDKDFTAAIDTLSDRYLDAQATTELSVGHKLTGNLVGHGNRDLLSPTLPSGAPNPYYNGGSEELKTLSKDDLDQAKTLIARDGRDAVIAHLKSQGYDTSGL